MKNKMTMIALGLFVAVGAGAQTIYDATDMASKDLNGTARFVGMGGAMGALGGDISTIGTNPAGIGIYRSNDAMMSFGYSSMGTKSKYEGESFNADKNRWSFDNAGFVIATKIGNETPLRYVNIGFNYHKAKSFNRSMDLAGDLNGMSQLFFIESFSKGINPTPQSWNNTNPFNDGNIGWLSALAYKGHLIDPQVTTNNTGYPYMDKDNNQLKDKDGNPLYLEDSYISMLGDNDYPYLREFRSRETGGIDQYDFNIAFNFNDRIYLGLTVGAYDVDYNKYTLYDEDFRNANGSPTGSGYFLESFNKVTGSGFDVKLGAIFRPFEYSPLRVGLAVHTPIFYNLTWGTSARLVSDLYSEQEQKKVSFTVDSYDYLNNYDMKQEYKLNTPWTYNLSLAYTIGSQLALGAEYEYKDYSSMRYYDSDGNKKDYETREAKLCLKGVSTIRAGLEYKVVPEFALRLGYNYSSSAYKNDAVKYLPVNSIQTDTDFANLKSLSNYTLGIGYRGSLFYADLAYKYSVQKADFYPFFFPVQDGNVTNLVSPTTTKVTDSRSQVLLTLGMRF
ncbi:MAG: outer membrane protein transport protein [Bacteroides sp.]|nr:outer membrane protein transport protein [Bacteroides sp.]MCI1682178.1 outer membrane protein transport protein [Bacteroides sp.]